MPQAALAKPGAPPRLLQYSLGTSFHKERLAAYLYQAENSSNRDLLLFHQEGSSPCPRTQEHHPYPDGLSLSFHRRSPKRSSPGLGVLPAPCASSRLPLQAAPCFYVAVTRAQSGGIVDPRLVFCVWGMGNWFYSFL